MFSFIKNVILSVTFILTAMLPSLSHADALQELIDKYCSKDCVSSTKLMDVVTRASKSFNIDKRAILAIIHVESKYHIRAKNGSSVGLSQVLLRYHKPKFKGKNYYDVEDNIFAGMQVMRDCLRKTKRHYGKAFACYNGGGDPKYRVKAMRAFRTISLIDLPKTNPDPLGSFIEKKLRRR